MIKSILGVMLLVLQICLILYKSGKAIYNKIKSKDVDGAIEEAEKLKDDLQDLHDNVKK